MPKPITKHLKKINKQRLQKKKESRNFIRWIQDLPIEIQILIYSIAISNHMKKWFQEHKTRFLSSISRFHIDLKSHINETNDGYWINNEYWYGGVSQESILEGPTYKHVRHVCKKKIQKSQELVRTALFTQEEIQEFNLDKVHQYTNSPGWFWLHPKCRCKSCDWIKIACIRTQTAMYQTEKKEYGICEKPGGFNGWFKIPTMSAVGGYTYIDYEDTVNIHNFHKQFKGIKTQKKTWKNHDTYLEHLTKLFS